MKKFWKIAGILLGGLILLIVVVPLVIPIPVLETRPIVELGDADSKFIPIDGIEVHYKNMDGTGPAIILLHGFGASVFSWREVMQPLSELGPVYAYDRPGFGLTERPLPGDWEGENPYSLDGQVNMLGDFLDANQISEAILVGNSAGGTVATAFALQHPERVRALVAVDAAIYQNEKQTPGWIHWLLSTPQAQRIGPFFMRSIRDWGAEMISTAWHDPGKIPAGVMEGYTKPLQAQDWDKGLYEVLKAREANDLAARLGGLKIPVLVITGDDDRIVPTQSSIQLADAIPDARLAILPACGHVPQEECPDSFLNAMIPFLTENTR